LGSCKNGYLSCIEFESKNITRASVFGENWYRIISGSRKKSVHYLFWSDRNKYINVFGHRKSEWKKIDKDGILSVEQIGARAKVTGADPLTLKMGRYF